MTPGKGGSGKQPAFRLSEDAPAKVNLTLRVLGRRADGYHDISSLVAFAAVGDRLELWPGAPLSLTVDGPFASGLDGENLVLRAARAVLWHWPDAAAGAFRLHKTLPVAAGIGGGSADAAAALRLLARANAGIVDAARLETIAAGLGSDVPVCLAGRTALMSGRGDALRRLSPLPRIYAVLTNPGVPLSTADVFSRLKAPSGDGMAKPEGEDLRFSDVNDLAAHIRAAGNDLTAPALQIAPVIGKVLAALEGQPGCLAASMSGSGATCFGIFPDEAATRDAAARLGKQNTGWWIVATQLR